MENLLVPPLEDIVNSSNSSKKWISHSLADIVLHILLVGCFVIIFFFVYATVVERNVVQDETKEIVEDLSREISVLLTDEQNNYVRVKINTIKYPDLSDVDQKVAVQNKALMWKSFYVGCAIVIVCVIAILLLWFIGGFSMSSLILHNSVALVSIGLTDFVFLTFFARQYKPSDSSFVKKNILINVRDWASK